MEADVSLERPGPENVTKASSPSFTTAASPRLLIFASSHHTLTPHPSTATLSLVKIVGKEQQRRFADAFVLRDVDRKGALPLSVVQAILLASPTAFPPGLGLGGTMSATRFKALVGEILPDQVCGGGGGVVILGVWSRVVLCVRVRSRRARPCPRDLTPRRSLPPRDAPPRPSRLLHSRAAPS